MMNQDLVHHRQIAVESKKAMTIPTRVIEYGLQVRPQRVEFYLFIRLAKGK